MVLLSEFNLNDSIISQSINFRLIKLMKQHISNINWSCSKIITWNTVDLCLHEETLEWTYFVRNKFVGLRLPSTRKTTNVFYIQIKQKWEKHNCFGYLALEACLVHVSVHKHVFSSSEKQLQIWLLIWWTLIRIVVVENHKNTNWCVVVDTLRWACLDL